MGNCQAAETAAPSAEIEHPDGKKEKIYRPIIAGDIMSASPGYYVAVVTFSGSGGGEETPAKHLSLLRPNENLNIGHAYRLVSFEEVLREFGLRKRVRLSRLVDRRKERDEGKEDGAAAEVGYSSPNVGPSTSYIGGRPNCSLWRQSQWKPTLPSIAELGI